MSDDISEIVRELRLSTNEYREHDAADEIERLIDDVMQQADALRQEKDEIERLREENRKLRDPADRPNQLLFCGDKVYVL